MWKDCSTDLKPLRKAVKQSVPRLRAVDEKQGYHTLCEDEIFANGDGTVFLRKFLFLIDVTSRLFIQAVKIDETMTV